MKPKLALFASVSLFAVGGSTANAALIAYWNFNGLAITTASAPGTGGVPTSIAADSGSATIDLSSFGGTIDDFAGSTANALNGDAAGASLSVVAGGVSPGPYPGNSTYLSVSFSMASYVGLVVTFDTRGTATGFDSGVWSYSIDGGGFTVLPGVNTASRSTTFSTVTADFSAVTALDGAASVVLRYTVDGATSASGNNRIDNLQLNTIPEPTSVLLGALGFVGILRRRR